jgi:hypothetical protein
MRAKGGPRFAPKAALTANEKSQYCYFGLFIDLTASQGRQCGQSHCAICRHRLAPTPCRAGMLVSPPDCVVIETNDEAEKFFA